MSDFQQTADEFWSAIKSKLDTLTEERAAANAANLAKSQFLANMSHELRTPLNSILGYSQLLDLVAGNSLSEVHRGYLRSIIRSGESLLGMVTDVLDFARIEAGQIRVCVRSCDVVNIARDAIAECGPQATENGVTVVLDDTAPAALHVEADPGRLGQTLRNLLSNAIKYNRSNGTVRVAVAGAPGQAVTISVTDTGYGIAQSDLPRLFQPYQRLGDDLGQTDGIGLGLSISRRLVEMMGGALSCHSVVDQGSTFAITLPGSLPLATRSSNPGAGSRDPLADMRILHLDDDATSRALMRDTIASLSTARLDGVGTWDEALDLLTSTSFDLLITDIHMPALSGFEVLARVRALGGALGGLPVVAFTAAALTRDMERAMLAGFDAYLTKPANVEDLLGTIAQVARRRSLGGVPIGRAAAKIGTNVLIAEDDPLVRRMLIGRLSERGYVAVGVENGAQALSRLSHFRPDLLVLDFSLPGMNGLELAKRIRLELAEVPIAFISGFADPSAIEGIEGRWTILQKPFGMDELCGALEGLAALA